VTWRGFVSALLIIFYTDVGICEEPKDLNVPLLTSGCPMDEMMGLKGMLAIELSTMSPETAAWVAKRDPRVEIACTTTQLKIEILDANLDRVIEQRVALTDEVTSDLKRFLGLTITELLAACAAGEILPNGEAPRPPEGPEALPVDTTSATEKRQHPPWRWQLTYVLRTGGSPFWTSHGAALLGEVTVISRLNVALEFQFSIGKEAVSLGEIRTDFWSGAFFILADLSHGVVAVRPGIGFRAGAVSWKGEPDYPAQVTSRNPTEPWGGPAFTLMTGVEVAKPLAVAIDAEVGAALIESGALVDDRMVLSLRGVWFMLKIGLGVTFG
jgi:hypothetical protein